jgi:hypothetical protein
MKRLFLYLISLFKKVLKPLNDYVAWNRKIWKQEAEDNINGVLYEYPDKYTWFFFTRILLAIGSFIGLALLVCFCFPPPDHTKITSFIAIFFSYPPNSAQIFMWSLIIIYIPILACLTGAKELFWWVALGKFIAKQSKALIEWYRKR